MDSLKSPQIYESPKNFEELETLAIIWDTLGEQVRHIACDICGNDSRMCLESWSPCRPSGEETICFSYTTSCKGETDWDSDEFPAKYLWMSDEDAKKEFTLTVQTGFGVDGGDLRRQKDFENVRGAFDKNPFVVEVQKHIEAKEALGNELIERIKNVK